MAQGKRGKGKTATPAYRAERADGEIRRSQLVTTYGPGALVDLVNDAVLVCGLDRWHYCHPREGRFNEPRLRARIMRRLKMFLSESGPFRLPPAGNDDAPQHSVGIDVETFPVWFVCQNQQCRELVRRDDLEYRESAHRFIHKCSDGSEHNAIPVRFVVTCKQGHLEEFPWHRFVHAGTEGTCTSNRYKLVEGPSGDFSEVQVVCKLCGIQRRMSEATAEDTLPLCLGRQPWLGSDARDPDGCRYPLELLIRTASYGYFGQHESALTIPGLANPLDELVREMRGVLQAVEEPGELKVIRRTEGGARLSAWTNDEVFAAIERDRKGGSKDDYEPPRTAEYRRFLAEPEQHADQTAPYHEDFFARRLPRDSQLPPEVACVVVAHKLREVRALVGFTRLSFTTADLQGEFNLHDKPTPLSRGADWLPAIEILGEGVFINLDEELVAAWEERPAVVARAKELERAYDKWFTLRNQIPPPFPGIRYYMLHSLSHLLINAVALDCGYEASSISERIYCSYPGAAEDDRMAAILLSTGSAGSEGTLGGLVEQGRRLHQHLARAHDMAKLCSHDPVCGGHDPLSHGERYLHGAACHGCLFVSETSCERFNSHLDRALVVPVMGQDRDLAFLRDWT